MKKRQYLWSLCAAAALWTGCAKDEAVSESGTRLAICPEVEQGMDETRVTIEGAQYAWSDADRIGVFVENAARPTHNTPAALRYENGKAYFSAAVNGAASGDRIYAYYPYTAEAVVNGGRVELPLPMSQSQRVAGSFNGEAMPMAAVPAAVSADGSPVQLHFVPMASVACFKIWSSSQAFRNERIVSVIFTAGQPIAGSLSIPYTVTDPASAGAVTDGLTKTSISTILSRPALPGVSKADASAVYMVVPALTLGELKVAVVTNVATYSFVANANKSYAFGRNAVKSFSLDLASTMAERVETNGQPFSITLYDYINRDPSKRSGQIGWKDEFPADLLVYSVQLNNPLIQKYWVYADDWKNLQPYNTPSRNEDLTALVVGKGEMKTESGEFDIWVKEGISTTAIAIVAEFASGERTLYRTHVLTARRGMINSTSW